MLASSNPIEVHNSQDDDSHTPAAQEHSQEEVLENTVNETVSPHIQVNPISTYASLVDPEEGTELKFISTEFIEGKKIAKINKEDVEQEIAYWQNAVIFSVLGANPPFDITQGFIRRIWGNYDIDKMLQVKKGMFLVRFNNLQDKLAVERRGVYYFDAKPILVKGWNPQMDLHTESINSLPIWIHY